MSYTANYYVVLPIVEANLDLANEMMNMGFNDPNKDIVQLCNQTITSKERVIMMWENVNEEKYPTLWAEITTMFSEPKCKVSEILRIGEDYDDIVYECSPDLTQRVLNFKTKVQIDLGNTKYEY